MAENDAWAAACTVHYDRVGTQERSAAWHKPTLLVLAWQPALHLRSSRFQVASLSLLSFNNFPYHV